jgi:predicted TIM-barrel fold metal-dependent hydrolase
MNASDGFMYNEKIIDSHFHAYTGKDCGVFIKDLIGKTGLASIVIASIPKALAHSEHFYNREALKLKKEMPDKVYLFGALDYSDKSYLEGKVDFAEQAKRLFKAGADGMKMLEGKPNARKTMGIPLNSDIFDSYYSYMEKNAYPILMHVADPETFWDPDKAPAWAKKHGWFWGGGTFPEKEQLYRESEAVLEKFPKLKITFAHFYFLSADINRASKFLDKWKNVSFDITPGWEMYDNFTSKSDEWRKFFIKYQDRIIFGTDNTPPLKNAYQDQLNDSIKKIAKIRNFLETDKEMLCGCGLNLGNKVLEKIYSGNFLKLLRIAQNSYQ